MDQKTDVEIVAKVLKGDRQAYTLLIESYKGQLYNLSFRMTGSHEDADDLTQEIFVKAYHNLPKFDQRKKFFTWLYTLGINLIRNHLKKKKREHAIDWQAHRFALARTNQQEDRTSELLSEERLSNLEEQMQKLPLDLREVLILKYQQGLTFEEIAAVNGEKVGAVKMRTYRALDKLKKLIE